MIKNRYSIVAIHIVGCLAFLSLPIWFANETALSAVFYNKRTQLELLTYGLIVAYFYLNYYLLLPRFYFQKKYVVFGLITVVAFLVVHYLPLTILGDEMGGQHPPPMPHGQPDGFEPPRPQLKHKPDFFFIGNHAFNFLLGFFLSLIVRVSNQLRKAQQEKLSAELSFLKAQINPHFIFNTLNSLYAMALDGSKDMADAVAKLSGIMRYVLNDAPQEYVSLEKEIEHIKSYVELQQYRFEDTVDILFEIEGDTKGKKIAPLLLIPFIENAFKHGVNPEEESKIQIQICITKTQLMLYVSNNKVLHTDEHDKSGIGLENTRNRLNLLYGGKFLLAIKDTEKSYSVSLSLDLE